MPALHRHDEKSNKALPGEIIRTGHHDWISELVQNLYYAEKTSREILLRCCMRLVNGVIRR